MSFAASDLGELRSLATALGLLDGDGNFNDDWLSAPGDHLSSILASATQRDALVAFVDDVLGGQEREEDEDGLIWLPIVSHQSPDITLYLVLDERPADSVSIGVGVRLTTASPASHTTAYVPLFRAAKQGRSVPSAILIGTANAVIRLSTEVTVGTAPSLRGLGLTLRVPTGGGTEPGVALALKGLQLPGAAGPRDLEISLSRLDELDDAALDLILGLVRAQADAVGSGPLASVVGLLGLGSGGPIPALPLHEVATRGASSLSTWFASVMSSASARTAWVGHLAALVGGTVEGLDVALTLGPAEVRVGVGVAIGPDGHEVVTPTLAVFVEAGASARIRAEADLVRLDLAAGTARSLPRLAAFAQLGRRTDGGADVLSGDPAVEGVRVGIALDADRRPTFLLAADRVTIGTRFYETLDLSTPGAVAEAGGALLGDVVDDLLGQLGPVGTTARVFLGLSAPPGDPGVTLVELQTFLADPLGAVRGYWTTLLRDHAAAVPGILTTLRDLVADASRGGTDVEGAGTEEDPWRVPLIRDVTLNAWRAGTGDTIEIAIAAGFVSDTLGNRCTRVEFTVGAGLARLDLAARQATFLSSADVRLVARARGSDHAAFVVGPITLTADHVGLRARWRPAEGVRVDVLAPNLRAEADDFQLPLALPVIGPDGQVTLDADGWDALEGLIGLLASVAPLPWIADLAVALGWLPAPEALPFPRLRLADLATGDSAAAVKSWLTRLALDDAGRLENGLASLARIVSGSDVASGRLEGLGTPANPWRLLLRAAGPSPQVGVWLAPDGPPLAPITTAPEAIQIWRPGDPGLAPGELAAAIRDEATSAVDIADLASDRADLGQGLSLLVERWAGTDGLIVPPGTAPAGVIVHRVPGATVANLPAAIDLPALLGAVPDVSVEIAIVRAGADLPWPSAPADRVIDLRSPSLSPESFVVPTVSSGLWFVALAPRADARLAAGDPDGTIGQRERLARVLRSFEAVAGTKILIAHGGVGHASLAAANDLAFVSAVITVGTPLTPVAFTIVDDRLGGDALRLLRWLIPPRDPVEPDDRDLARGRDVVEALVALTAEADPGADLRPPAAPVVPRAGLAVHAFFGVLTEDDVTSAMTAIVAAGLAARAIAREDARREPVDGARAGIRIPLAVTTPDLAVTGWAQLQLIAADGGVAAPALSTAPVLDTHLEFRRPGGWISGGPNGTDAPPPAELRWLSAHVRLPFDAVAAGSAEIVLHEPTVFGIARERWVVRPTGAPGTDVAVATPALPEVRVLMSLVAERLTQAAVASPPLAAVVGGLRALGVLGPAGGTNPDGIDHLLHDTAAHVADALGDSSRRAEIGAAVTALLTGVSGASVDLAARRLTLDASGTPGDRGMLSWTAHVDVAAPAGVTATASIGSPGSSAAGGAVLRFDAATGRATPVTATIDWHRGSGPADSIALWPLPDAAALARAVARLVPAECARAALEFLRGLDASATLALDAAFDALGLLSPPDVAGRRHVLLPVRLLADPLAWLQHSSALGGPQGFNATRVVALLDALKPVVGIGGAPGEWELGPGVTLVTGTDAGHLTLGITADTTAFTPVAGAVGRLAAVAHFGLTIPPDGAPRPRADLSLGVAGAAPGRRAVHVALNGGVRVFVRPDAGPDLPLYPNPPGLGQLAQVVVTQALPVVLDALASENGANLAGEVGAVVRSVGDALDLRRGLPPAFDGSRLQAWAANPAQALSAAIPTLTGAALQAIATSLQPLLPAGSTATVQDGRLTVAVAALTLTWRPAPFEIGLGGAVTGVEGVERVEIDVTLDGTGLAELRAVLGPASLDAGGATLRPYFSANVGQSPAGGRYVDAGLSRDADGTECFAARWNLETTGLSLVAIDGAAVSADPEDVAVALLDAVLDLVAAFAIRTPAVEDLLDRTVGGTDVRNVLRGVLLQDVPDPTSLEPDLFDPGRLLARLQKLASNLADADPSIDVGGGLSIGLRKDGSIAKLTLGVNGRVPLSAGAVVVAIEADSRWIKDQPPAGLAISVLDTGGSTFTFAPGLEVDGIGLRFSKSEGPLLDIGVTLGSIAVHLFGRVESGGALAGGLQLQLSDLAVAVAGAQGGNPVAQGLMRDSGSGPNRLAPAFSPALAVQKHGNGPVLVTLRAGEGSGPWWLAIQRGFGPLYVEQVGFGVTVEQDQLKRISLLLDGRVSIFGLTAAVDDLQLTYVVASNASVFDPSRWAVDLAGLAINADLAGITLAGGLRKFGEGDSVEYVGMLLARFGPYGLSVFGGYGTAVVAGERFAAFFAFGAVNGPIGGPPAFFLTGIGGGLGINRGLTFPDDLARFDQFPFIKALDPSARPSEDPMAELALLRVSFPMKRGEFWFAAGISFTSFALVDGIAVVAVAIGDGLEVALLGLARLALPRPQFPLVSIELGLIARFSTKEGVFWVQAQLTDNSWLLHESVRLTGGFAFVTWFAGPNKGQFVLTIGGFHPDFHRDGYPVVPRLGFRWSVSDAIVVKGESYFALTSEAVMAGGELKASADFGPAWAHVRFGANGIVYFDPFRFDVEVYAHVSAGVTIDVWIGEITIRVSIGARIRVMGPKIHGRATFDVGPVELTVAFGSRDQSGDRHISWDAFVRKYLEEASPGVARVLTAIPGKGSLPPGTGPGGTTDTGTADGSLARPFEVFAEFEITVTTTVPTVTIRSGGSDATRTPSHVLGLAPMNIASAGTVLVIALRDALAQDWIGALLRDVREPGAFPLGVWGPPQPVEDRKVPRGDIVEAIDSVRFEARASIQGTLPGQIAYNRLDPPGPRKPLPFVHARAFRPGFVGEAEAVSALLPDVHGGAATFRAAKPWLAAGGYGRTALAAIERERAAPPRLGTLTQGLVVPELPPVPLRLPDRAGRPPVDTRVRPARAIAILASPVLPERPRARTTVDDRQTVRITPPTLESVRAKTPLAITAKLIRMPAPGATSGATVVATSEVPYTRAARAATAVVAERAADHEGQTRLGALSTALAGGSRAPDPDAAMVRAGEIVVLQMPNAARDLDTTATRPRLVVSGGDARVVVLGHGAHVLLDTNGTAAGTAVPPGAERIVVVAVGTAAAAPRGLLGWHGGQELAFVGWSSALGPGVVVQAEGGEVRQREQRFRAGWVRGAELVATSPIVNTHFTAAVTTIAILLDDPGTDPARELSLVLDGADRAAGKDGQPEAPLVVTMGHRSALVYGVVVNTASRTRRGVTVSVACEPGVNLAGVLGGTESRDAVARRLATHGLDANVQPLVPTSGGAVRIAWSESAFTPAPAEVPEATGESPAVSPPSPRRKRPRATRPKPGPTSRRKPRSS